VFGQTFNPQDLGVIGLLILLEGILSIDNALVLALLAKRLPKPLQARALTYGLFGAFAFRFVAIGAAAYLLRWRIVKLIGGGYLLWVALKHLILESGEKPEERLTIGPDGRPVLVDETTGKEITPAQEDKELHIRGAVPSHRPAHPGFWATVAVIEMTDIAFAVDSILAAIAVVGPAPVGHIGPHPKLWVVITGGMLGVILMRVAAAMFIRLLERFPRFETSAYLLVCTIGVKLVVDWGFNSAEHPHVVDFHDAASVAFWAFWLAMVACFGFGFLPQKGHKSAV
jgi:YkoY family integral membrane protein